MAATSVYPNTRGASARAEARSQTDEDPDRGDHDDRAAVEAHAASRALRVMYHEHNFTEEWHVYPNDGEQPAFAREFWEGRVGLDEPFENAQQDPILTRGDFRRSSALFAGDVGGIGGYCVSILLAFRPVRALCIDDDDESPRHHGTVYGNRRVMVLDATGRRPANLRELITEHAYRWYCKIAHGRVVGAESHVEVTVSFGTLRAARVTGRLTKRAPA